MKEARDLWRTIIKCAHCGTRIDLGPNARLAPAVKVYCGHGCALLAEGPSAAQTVEARLVPRDEKRSKRDDPPLRPRHR
jgi:hypothetical protein